MRYQLRILRLFIGACIGLATLSHTPELWAEFNLPACRKAVSQSRHLKLKPHERKFFKDIVAPALGRRAFLSAPDTSRIKRTGKNEFLLYGFKDSPDLRVVFEEGKDLAPKLETTRDAWVMTIPLDFPFKDLPDGGVGMIRHLLVGHNLNPFTESDAAQAERKILGEQAIVRRRVQNEAARAGIESGRKFDAGDKASQLYIYVGPMGTGKSIVIQDILKERLRPGKAEIHLIVSDRVATIEDRRDDSLHFGEDAIVMSFGGENSSQDLMNLVALAKKQKRPLILSTTIHSLDPRLADLTPDELATFRALVRTYVYDEAHHTGAPRSLTSIEKIVSPDDSKAFFTGMTGTPIHQTKDIEGGVFGNNAYWAYIDSLRAFRRAQGSYDRPLEDIQEQLARAIELGELTGVKKPYFINSSRFLAGQPEIFVMGAEGRYQIREDLMPQIAARLLPAIKKPTSNSIERGFMALNLTAEADKMGIALQNAAAQAGLKGRIEVMHSKVPNHRDILRDFKAGKIDFLVVVNQLDEAEDIPDLKVYVDLNHKLSPREFLQRLGRIMRLHLDKRWVNFYTFFDFDQVDLVEMLVLVDAMTKGRLSYDPLAELGRAQMRKLGQDEQTEPEDDEEVEVVDEAESGEADRILSGDFEMTDEELGAAMKDLQKRVRKLFNDKQRGPAAAARELNKFVEENDRLPVAHWSRSAETSLRNRLLAYRDEQAFIDLLNPKALGLVVALPIRVKTKSEKIAASVDALNKFVLDWDPEQAPYLPDSFTRFTIPATLTSKDLEMDYYSAMELLRTNPESLKRLSPRARFLVDVLYRAQLPTEKERSSVGGMLLKLPGGSYNLELISTHDTWIQIYTQELKKLGWAETTPAPGSLMGWWVQSMKSLLKSGTPAQAAEVRSKVSASTAKLLGISPSKESFVASSATRIEQLFQDYRRALAGGDRIEIRKAWKQYKTWVEFVAMPERLDRRDDFMALLSPEARTGFAIVRLENAYFTKSESRRRTTWNKAKRARLWGFILEWERLTKEAGLSVIPLTHRDITFHLHGALHHSEDPALQEQLKSWIEEGVLSRRPVVSSTEE